MYTQKYKFQLNLFLQGPTSGQDFYPTFSWSKGPLFSWMGKGFSVAEFAPAVASDTSFLWPSSTSLLKVWVTDDAELMESCKLHYEEYYR